VVTIDTPVSTGEYSEMTTSVDNNNRQRRCAFVTGGGTGIGRSAVLALARSGYHVGINYSRSADAAEQTGVEARAFGIDAFTLAGDVSDEPSVQGMRDALQARFGHLDVLINNAGTTLSIGARDFDSITPEQWDRVFDVNVKGIFLVTRAMLPLLRLGTTPCVVNTCSIVGIRPGPQPLPYAASKAAAVNLTKTFAGALGPDIRVNGVAPGWMEGEWMQRALKDNYQRLMERRAKATPLARCVTADDVAETMMSLVQGNRFVTGEVVVVDGGYTAVT
jgi:3-oxoacyl-[acyl-carrier protein] reductase